MSQSDLLVVFGASFSNHTGIEPTSTIVQIDSDPNMLGRFHPVSVGVLGDAGLSAEAMVRELGEHAPLRQEEEIAQRWRSWRDKKARRAASPTNGGLTSADVFEVLNELVPDDAIIAVDVGNNTYSFGRYFECQRQTVLMSGYLGSIGFGLPAAIGAWAATQESGTPHEGRPVIAISGDGGLGQYLAELTTAVKYEMNITHIVLNNEELGKISKEQRDGAFEVWQTGLHNPNFAQFATLCGAFGARSDSAEDLRRVVHEAITHDGPALVEAITDPDEI